MRIGCSKNWPRSAARRQTCAESDRRATSFCAGVLSGQAVRRRPWRREVKGLSPVLRSQGLFSRPLCAAVSPSLLGLVLAVSGIIPRPHSRPRCGSKRFGAWRSPVAICFGSRGRRFKSLLPDQYKSCLSAASRLMVSISPAVTLSANQDRALKEERTHAVRDHHPCDRTCVV